jgi:hypothetical protein
MSDENRAAALFTAVYGIVGAAALVASLWPMASVWACAKDFLNSVFIISAVGSAAGAAAGAMAAQRIADRGRITSELLKEIRSTNVAIAHGYSVSNTAIASKKQIVAPFFDNYEQQKKVDDEVREKESRNQRVAYEFTADFRTLPELQLPLSPLRELLTEKISASSRAIVLFNTLEQAASGHNRSIDNRNELVQQYKKIATNYHIYKALYFGTPLPDGMVNREYPDMVRAIYQQTNDIIFLGVQLCEELVQHGNSLAIKAGRSSPKIAEVNFEQAKKAGLLPNDSDYASWFDNFKKK